MALDPSRSAPAEPERVRLRARTRGSRRRNRAARVVVCLTHVMPVAPRAGNEYRIYRMLKWLRRTGYVVIPNFVAPADGSQPGGAEARAIAEEFGNAIVCLPDGRIEYVLRDVPDVLRSLDGTLTGRFAATLAEQRARTNDEREMLRIDRCFCSDALIATVLRLESVLGPYVLLAEYIWMSRVLPLLGGHALKVIDTIDVFSTRHEKVGQFGVEDLVVEPAAEQRRLRRGDVAIADPAQRAAGARSARARLDDCDRRRGFRGPRRDQRAARAASPVRRLGQSHEPPRPARLPAACVADWSASRCRTPN